MDSATTASGRYATIVADPPWQLPYGARYGKGGRRSNRTKVPYSFLSLAEIMALPVPEMADDQAHLYLWSTRRNFREGIAAAVARAWGFEPRGELIWGLRNGDTAATTELKCGLWGCGRRATTTATVQVAGFESRNIFICPYHAQMIVSADKEPRS